MLRSVRFIRLWGLLALLVVLTGLVGASPAVATPVAQRVAQPVVVYFFWGDGCPHCAAAKPFLAELGERYPSMVVRDYEVWYHEENQAPFIQMAAKFGFEPSGVPTIFIGDQHWEGFAEGYTDLALEAAVATCVATGCADAGAGVIEPLPTAVPPPATPVVVAAAEQNAVPLDTPVDQTSLLSLIHI